MRTLVTVLALQMFVGASAFAERTEDNAVADVGVQTATVQAGGSFNDNRAEDMSRVKQMLASLEEDGAGGGGGGGGGSSGAGRVRGATATTPRPTGNDFGIRDASKSSQGGIR